MIELYALSFSLLFLLLSCLDVINKKVNIYINPTMKLIIIVVVVIAILSLLLNY